MNETFTVYILIADRPDIPLDLDLKKSLFTEVQKGFALYCEVDPYLTKKLENFFPVFDFFDNVRQKNIQIVPTTKNLPQGVNELFVRFLPKNSPVKENPQPGTGPILIKPKTGASAGLFDRADAVQRLNDYDHSMGDIEIQIVNCSDDGDFGILEDQAISALVSGTSSGLHTETTVDSSEFLNEGTEIAPEHQNQIVPATTVSKSFNGRSSSSALKLEEIPPLRLSKPVLEMIQAGRVLHNTSPFIRESGRHLLDVKWNPTPQDYVTYVTFLLTNFPELDTPALSQDNCIIGDQLKKMLTTFARNHRHRFGSQVRDEDRKRGSLSKSLENDQVAAPVITGTDNDEASSSAAPPPTKKQRKTANNTTTEGSNDPLSQLKIKNLDVDLACELLKECGPDRRELIENSDSISKIIATFPVFSSYRIITCEFYLCIGIERQMVEESFEKLVTTLQKLYGKPSSTTEAEKLQLLCQLDRELQINISKKLPAAFNIEKLGAGSSVVKPSNIKSVVPVSVSYISSDGELQETVIIGEGKTIATKSSPSAFNAYELLCGAYYTFHRRYSDKSKNTMDFLDLKLLNKQNFNQSKKFTSFKKRYDSI